MCEVRKCVALLRTPIFPKLLKRFPNFYIKLFYQMQIGYESPVGFWTNDRHLW